MSKWKDFINNLYTQTDSSTIWNSATTPTVNPTIPSGIAITSGSTSIGTSSGGVIGGGGTGGYVINGTTPVYVPNMASTPYIITSSNNTGNWQTFEIEQIRQRLIEKYKKQFEQIFGNKNNGVVVCDVNIEVGINEDIHRRKIAGETVPITDYPQFVSTKLNLSKDMMEEFMDFCKIKRLQKEDESAKEAMDALILKIRLIDWESYDKQ